MREILFRGKTFDGKWEYGDLRHGGYIRHVTETYIMYADYALHNIPIIHETVGQYTGLKDKNGKRIFEGDIFKFNDEIWSSSYTSCGMEYDSCEVENYGVVGFDEYSAKYDFVKYKYNENSVEADLHENGTLEFAAFLAGLEIVGNIHDNPELLEDA